MAKKEIYLVRHGRIKSDEEKRYIGQSDLELTEEGILQAQKLYQTLKSNPLDQIYCSNLRRTQKTAEIIGAGRGLVPVVLPELREINMGIWEGERFADIRANYPDEFERRGQDPANFKPFGGECFKDLYDRVIPVFERIINETQKDILFVSHAGVNRVILAHALGLPLRNIFKLKQEYGCLNVISFDGKTLCVEKMNST
ncbi:alpha-ribazole phosphatase [Desulfitobacterium sp. AusDCA]|uniref:alpha-ribazole phosphatase n=1 Tax=Desulfitobacterium sp. AusDCA TaxID=3240383 RepID=UPI003DA713FF